MRNIALLLLLSGAFASAEEAVSPPQAKSASKETPTTEKSIPKKEVWLTVFVHGIMSVQPHVSISNMARFLQDNIHNTAYAETIRIMREDDFFHKNQAMQGRGLLPINLKDTSNGSAAALLSVVMNEMEKAAGITNTTNHYYTFGWSGLLSYSNRYRDSILFFEELEKLAAQFKKKGIDPKIRVIGYSHGGNVCLSLALVHQEHFELSDLRINELVLIATPIQQETDYFVNDPLFERVYNLFSKKDRIQPLDFFNKSRYFANRTFKQRKGFTLPDKLVQVELKVTRVRKDICKKSPQFEKTGNFTKKSILWGTSPLLRDMSPGHIENWFFSWTPRFYRSNTFPLSPVPMISILPFIRKQVERIEYAIPPCSPLIFDLRPEHDVILFKQRINCRTPLVHIMPFMKPGDFQLLENKVLAIRPPYYTRSNYKKHIMQAAEKAHTIHHAKRRARERRYHAHEAPKKTVQRKKK